jgi:hypothetical protein
MRSRHAQGGTGVASSGCGLALPHRFKVLVASSEMTEAGTMQATLAMPDVANSIGRSS